MKKTTIITSIFLIFGIFGVLNAWTGPTSAPPAGNMEEPLNVSNQTQVKYGYLYFPKWYDGDNAGYYVDPASNSWLYRLYSYDVRADIYYDRNNTSYYLNPASTSRLNEVQANRVYGFTDIRSPIFYDYNNTGYYLDPASTSRLNRLYYVNQAYIVDLRPQYMYDWNDSAYYIDMNRVSMLNDLRVNILYDRNNTGYYLDPASTSRINYGVFNNVYSYGWVQAASFLYASDRSLKKNIQIIDNSLDKILTLEGVSFEWKDKEKGENKNIGLIAQDVEKVFPELVYTNETTGLKSVQYGNLVAPLIEAIKEQNKKIEEQKSMIENLSKEIEKIKLNI